MKKKNTHTPDETPGFALDVSTLDHLFLSGPGRKAECAQLLTITEEKSGRVILARVIPVLHGQTLMPNAPAHLTEDVRRAMRSLFPLRQVFPFTCIREKAPWPASVVPNLPAGGPTAKRLKYPRPRPSATPVPGQARLDSTARKGTPPPKVGGKQSLGNAR